MGMGNVPSSASGTGAAARDEGVFSPRSYRSDRPALRALHLARRTAAIAARANSSARRSIPSSYFARTGRRSNQANRTDDAENSGRLKHTESTGTLLFELAPRADSQTTNGNPSKNLDSFRPSDMIPRSRSQWSTGSSLHPFACDQPDVAIRQRRRPRHAQASFWQSQWIL